MPGLYGFSGNANVSVYNTTGIYQLSNANISLGSISATNTTGLYTAQGNVFVPNDAQQLLNLLSNNGSVTFNIDPSNTSKVEAFAIGGNGGGGGGNSIVSITGDISAYGQTGGIPIYSTLSNINVAAGTYGNISYVPVIKVAANGRVLSATVTAAYGNTQVAQYLAGNVNIGNITTTRITSGNITNSGNLITGTAYVAGNLYVAGNTVTRYTANTVQSQVIANSNIAATSTTTGALQSYGGLGVQGNIWGNAVYTDNYFYANGQPFASSLYSNANVASYLPVYGGAIDAIQVANASLINVASQGTVQLQYDPTGVYNVYDIATGSWLYIDNSGMIFSSNVNGTAKNAYFDNSGNLQLDGQLTITNGIYWSNGQPYVSSTYSNVNVAAYIPTDPTITAIQANIGAFEIYANANAATQATSINNINANLGSYQNTTNANIGTIYNNLNTLTANVGAYEIYANANIGTLNLAVANITTNANANIAAYLENYIGNIGQIPSIAGTVVTYATDTTFVPPPGLTSVNILVVGGGGGGGSGVFYNSPGSPTYYRGAAGGGGDGGQVSYYANVPVSGPVAITIGAGGAGGSPAPSTMGGPGFGFVGGASSFGGYSAAGGNGGGKIGAVVNPSSGFGSTGSGSQGGYLASISSGPSLAVGGGGGAGAFGAGTPGVNSTVKTFTSPAPGAAVSAGQFSNGGAGGAGVYNSITGANVVYAGGGGGGSTTTTPVSVTAPIGGSGGGGTGGYLATSPASFGVIGPTAFGGNATYYGGGGGGGTAGGGAGFTTDVIGGAGYPGVVIVQYSGANFTTASHIVSNTFIINGPGITWANGVDYSSTITGSYGNANVAAYLPTDPTFTGYLTFANANAATQATSINSINANLGAFQTYSNTTFATKTTVQTLDANVGTIFTRVNTLQANVGAYEIYANANLGTATTNINSINANLGAYQTYANTSIQTINSNLGAYQTYANTSIQTISANLGAFETYANLHFSDTSYGNSNVAAYLPIYGGNVLANYVLANSTILSTTNGPTSLQPGQLAWDILDETVSVGMLNGVTLQLGQEQYIRVKASAAITNGQGVMFTGSLGDNITAAPNDVTSAGYNSSYFIGIATQDIATNDFGYITTFGKVHGLNTNSYTVGDILYASTSTPGALTATEPTAPGPKIQVAAVIKVAGGDGHIFVRPTVYPTIAQLSDVIDAAANYDYLRFSSTGNVWSPASLTTDPTIQSIQANIGGSQIYANTAIQTINANLGAFETYANLNFGTSGYGNLQVAAYLPTDPTIYTIQANLGAFETYANATFGTSGYGNLQVGQYLTDGATAIAANLGNVITSNGVFWANGTAYSSGSGTYGNTQVNAYLNTTQAAPNVFNPFLLSGM